jgi:hypothetical protein
MRGVWDRGGRRNDKRVMIRHRPRKGRESGIGKRIVPGRVEKGTIESSENGIFLLIGPGIQPISEREFKPANITDQTIEKGG